MNDKKYLLLVCPWIVIKTASQYRQIMSNINFEYVY